MKNIQKLNLFAISVPIFLLFLNIFFDGFYLFALVSLILTGLIQIVLSICVSNDFNKNPHLRAYFILVALFFILWFITYCVYLIILPIVLAFYFTYILHFTLKHKDYENA